MLTESEKQWIEHREAMQFLTGTYIADFEEYPLWNPGKDWQEAAEFEARVAAKLANPQWAVCWHSDSCLEFGGSKDEPRWVWDCEWCRLKHARLQVEEEMNADIQAKD